jgi:hypothetical protein
LIKAPLGLVRIRPGIYLVGGLTVCIVVIVIELATVDDGQAVGDRC